MQKLRCPLNLFLIVLLAATQVAGGSTVVVLNLDNYDELTDSKTVFIKFYAPWCAHCKRMAADWDRLAADWTDDGVGLIGEVDCTEHSKGGGKELCNYFGIRSFPTLKYGEPSDLEEYNGGRTYEELAAFAKENLVPLCSVDHLELCDDEMKTTIEKYQGMSESALVALIEEQENIIAEAEALFARKVDELTELYQAAEKERKETVEDVVENGDLGLMRSVMMAKNRAAATGEADDRGVVEDVPNDEL